MIYCDIKINVIISPFPNMEMDPIPLCSINLMTPLYMLLYPPFIYAPQPPPLYMIPNSPPVYMLPNPPISMLHNPLPLYMLPNPYFIYAPEPPN